MKGHRIDDSRRAYASLEMKQQHICSGRTYFSLQKLSAPSYCAEYLLLAQSGPAIAKYQCQHRENSGHRKLTPRCSRLTHRGHLLPPTTARPALNWLSRKIRHRTVIQRRIALSGPCQTTSSLVDLIVINCECDVHRKRI